MRTTTLLATASAALLSSALAVERPRLYVPRQNNRLNGRSPAKADDEGTVTTVVISSTVVVSSEPTREPSPDLKLFGLSFNPLSEAESEIIVTSSVPVESPAPSSGSGDEASDDDGDDDSSDPTTTADTTTTAAKTEVTPTQTDSDEKGGLLDPVTDLLGDLLDPTTTTSVAQATTTDASETEAKTVVTTTTTTDAEENNGGLGGLLTSILGGGDSKTTAAASATTSGDDYKTGTETGSVAPTSTNPAEEEEEEKGNDGLGGILTSLLGGGGDDSKTTAAVTTSGTGTETGNVAPTSTTNTAEEDDNDGLGGILTSLLGNDPSATPSGTGTETGNMVPTSTSAPEDDDGLGGILTSLLGEPTPPPTSPSNNSTSTADDGLGGILTSLLGEPTPTAPPSNGTHTTDGGLGGILTSLTSALLPTETLSLTSDLIPALPTGNGTLPTLLPGLNGTATDTYTSTPTPTLSPSSPGLNHTIPYPTTYTESSTTTTDLSETSSVPTSTPTPSVPLVTTKTIQSTVQITSIRATATITDSESWLPTSLVLELTTPSSTPSRVLAPTTTHALPSNLPKMLTPLSGGEVQQPPDTTLIIIAFKYAFHYEFLCQNPVSALQIFTYLPIALSQGQEMPFERIAIKSLVPSLTQDSLDYLMTKALVYYPNEGITDLRKDIRLPNTQLYHNPSELVRNLTSTIDSSIDILTGEPWDDEYGSPGTTKGTSGDRSGHDDGGVGSNGGSDNGTPQQSARTVGFVVGGIALAGAYSVIMFVVARRYKRKRQSHQRTSSLGGGGGGAGFGSVGAESTYHDSPVRYSTPDMSMVQGREFTGYGGVAAGMVAQSPITSAPGMGRHSHGSGRTGATSVGNAGSPRTAWISAPVAAENSLGWN